MGRAAAATGQAEKTGRQSQGGVNGKKCGRAKAETSAIHEEFRRLRSDLGRLLAIVENFYVLAKLAWSVAYKVPIFFGPVAITSMNEN